MGSDASGEGISALFGHSPFVFHNDTDCFVEQSFANNSKMTIDTELPSLGEGMVDNLTPTPKSQFRLS